MIGYYYDTYAIIEIITNNINYAKYRDLDITTSIFNIGELYMYLLRNYNKKTADHWNKLLTPKLIEIDKDIVIKAMIFKHNNKKLNLSLIDCLGYITAISNNLKFLTGDKQFKDFPNVEFVK